MYDDRPDAESKRIVSLQEIWDAVWFRRKQIGIVTLVNLLLAVIYLHVATPVYTASLNVAPVLSSNGGSLSRRIGGLSELASAAGIGLPQDQGETTFQLYVESLQSYAVAEELAKRTHLMRQMYPKEWDDATRSWKQPFSLKTSVVEWIKTLVGIPVVSWRPPDGNRVFGLLKKKVVVDESPKKLIVTLSYSDENPALAAVFLQALHNTADNVLRTKALRRATLYSDYLQNKLRSVTVDDYRSALTAALIEQEKAKMAASSTTYFAAEPFGTVTVPPTPSSPKAIIILVGALLLSLFIGVVASLLAAAGLFPFFDRLQIGRKWPMLKPHPEHRSFSEHPPGRASDAGV